MTLYHIKRENGVVCKLCAIHIRVKYGIILLMSAETIVIIEDDHAIRNVISVVLKSAGYAIVKEAETGDYGLRLVRELKPSLVLLDIMMPKKRWLAGLQSRAEKSVTRGKLHCI